MSLAPLTIIFLVLLACLVVTALGASLFYRLKTTEEASQYNPSFEQAGYMRWVRAQNFKYLKRESLRAARDLKS